MAEPLIANSLDAAWSIQLATRGIDIVYRRLTVSPRDLPLKAVPGRTEYEEQTSDGSILVKQSRDFIFEAKLLVFDAVIVLPSRDSDYVIEDGLIYQIGLPGGGKEYDWEDHYRRRLRVHTKQVFKTP